MKKIVVDTSAVLITFRCNLMCKLCCTDSPYQKNPQHFPLERLNDTISKYFEIVSFIRKLSLGGGEPMLHPQIAQLLQATMQHSDKFDILEIITNGTIIPNKSVLNTMKSFRDKLYVMIDNYGKASFNSEKLAQLYSDNEINHSVRVYHGMESHMGGWVDLGDYSRKHNKNEAAILLSSCVISNSLKQRTGKYNPVDIDEDTLQIPYLAMTDGLLHRCARSYSTLLAGSIRQDSGCFVNIMDSAKSPDEIRSEIAHLYKNKHLVACEYCNGFSPESKRYMPAEQLQG
jgi:hypothetical protein